MTTRHNTVEDLEFKRQQFEYFHGPISGPTVYNQFCEFAGRQTGKTHAMIMALPYDGKCVIVVHNNRWAQELKRRAIPELRPDYPVENITFVSYGRTIRDFEDNIERSTRGVSLGDIPIFFDNAVQDLLLRHTVDKYTIAMKGPYYERRS